MPIYEYKCSKGHVFDVMQRVTDDPVTACEVCGKPVQRVFHPVAVHFKGSGFYNTDYGTRKRQREQAANGKAKTDSSSSDTSSSSDDAKGSSTAEKKSEPAKSPDKPKPATKAAK